MFVLVVLCLLPLQAGVLGFGIGGGRSLNHQEITERALLNVTVQTCLSVARSEDTDFSFPPQPFRAGSVAVACKAGSSKDFIKNIQLIQNENIRIDEADRLLASPSHHFNNEMLIAGRDIITTGLVAVKASNRLGNFKAARIRLGQILHSMQDFYSHSNWIELGNTVPNSNLLRAGTSIGNIAAPTRATCRNCDGSDCTNNILEDIRLEKLLTSGFFRLGIFALPKPAGKCSHGGFLDGTSRTEPRGGINKDEIDSDHGHLHFQAANVAITATSELLEDVREAAGDKTFLQMMGITRGRPLCFCIDTTGSMTDDIAAVRAVTASIIDRKVGTDEEPSVYILVPFNDPDFGPLTRTTNPDQFKAAINALRAVGGGDFPELALSGLRLALTGSPPGSEIFVFTDASAKDINLRDTVIALIEQTKSIVNFMITGSIGLRRRRSNDDGQQNLFRMTPAEAQVYVDVAETSGGLAVQVSKSQLQEATSIIVESSVSSLVTLVQAARSSGANNFTFTVDDSIQNLTIYITGRIDSFTLISPSGVSQTGTSGSLLISSQSVGNFQTLKLIIQVGVWEVRVVSSNAYTLKVIGQSPLDFFFNFVVPSSGPFGGFENVDNRPIAGVNGTLLITVTGDNTAAVTEVTLVESSGSREVNGRVTAQGGQTFLVHFDRIPSEAFVVLVKGQIGNSSTRASAATFQRQSTITVKASSLTVTADDSGGILEAGSSILLPFSVSTNGTGGTFNIQANNDQGFNIIFPSTLVLESGGSANGTVNLTAPLNTASGTEVTVTIEVQAPGGGDTNYVVLTLTVVKRVTDVTPPVCDLISLVSNCSDSCSSSTWALSLQLTDGANGTGIDSITLRQGNGTLNTSMASGNVTLVFYNASCCSPTMELVIVDRVGNVGRCTFSVLRSSNTTTPTTDTPTITNTTSITNTTGITNTTTTNTPTITNTTGIANTTSIINTTTDTPTITNTTSIINTTTPTTDTPTITNTTSIINTTTPTTDTPTITNTTSIITTNSTTNSTSTQTATPLSSFGLMTVILVFHLPAQMGLE